MQPNIFQSTFPDKAAPSAVATPAPDSGVDPTIKALASTIGQLETGSASPDAYTKKGASGEYGRYQFMPDTYKALATKYLGDGNAAPTVENQNKLVYSAIEDDKKAGLNPAQIMSKWNSGNPDAYKQNHRGVNSAGVAYDTPAYVQKGSAIYQQLKAQQQSPLGMAGVPSPQMAGQGSFLGDVSKTLSDTGTGLSNAVGQTFSGQINPLSGLIQSAGAVAGGIGGLTGNVLEHTPVVGSIYKGAEGLIGQGVGALANTDAGKGLISNYQGFQQAHPELAGDIGSAVDIASAIPLLKGLGVAKTAATSGIKSALKGGVEKAAAEALGADVPKLSEVKAGIKKGLITQGKNGPALAPDAAKQLSAKYVANEMRSGTIPKNAPPSQIAIGAEQAADKEAQNLEHLLSKAEIQNIVQPEDLQGLVDKVVERAGASATSGENPAQTLIKVFTDHLPKGKDILPVDILKARRAVGSFIRENRGDWTTRGVLTGFNSARNAFWDESRTLLSKLAPDVPVIPSLEKQSALYRVSDYIAPKVKKELTDASRSTFMKRHPVIRGLLRAGGKAAIEGTGVGAALRIMQ